MSHLSRLLVTLALGLAVTAGAQAHGRSWPNVVIQSPHFGFSYGAPLVQRYGYHYAPRWGYAPRGHYDRRYHDRRYRHFDRHDRGFKRHFRGHSKRHFRGDYGHGRHRGWRR